MKLFQIKRTRKALTHFLKSVYFLAKSSRPSFLGALSSAFEWYDYALFGYFATLISQQFFPQTNSVSALLYSFVIFASGFAMRPLGALAFGYIGDRVGREKALILSLTLMAIPTISLGLLPTYEQIGYYSTIILVIIRLMQGLAVGGNYGGTFIFTIESAPISKKSLSGSLAMFGTLGGLFLGSSIATLFNALFTQEALSQFGWRIPFLLGGFSAIVAYYIRQYALKFTTYHDKVLTNNNDKTPIRIILDNHLFELIKAIGIILLDGVGVYVVFVFMTTYATLFLHLPEQSVLLINTLSMGLLITSIPIFGYLGDLYNPRNILKWVSIGFIFLSLPLVGWLSYAPSLSALFLLQSVFAIIIGAAYGTLPITIVGIFPKNIRYTACGLAFNISVAVFGGTAPFVVTSLIHYLDLLILPGILLSLIGMISFLSIITLRKLEPLN